MLEKYIVLAFIPLSYVLVEILKKKLPFELLASFCIFIFTTALTYVLSSLSLHHYLVPLISFFVLALIFLEAKQVSTHQVIKLLYSIWLITFALIGQFDFFEFLAFLSPLMIFTDRPEAVFGQNVIFAILLFFAAVKQLMPQTYSSFIVSIYFILYFISLKLSFSSSTSFIKSFSYQVFALQLFGVFKSFPSFVMYSSLIFSLLYILEQRVERNKASLLMVNCLLSLPLINNISLLTFDYILFQTIFITIYYVEYSEISLEIRKNILIISLVASFALIINLHQMDYFNIHVLLSYILVILLQRMVFVRNFIPDSCYQPKEV